MPEKETKMDPTERLEKLVSAVNERLDEMGEEAKEAVKISEANAKAVKELSLAQERTGGNIKDLKDFVVHRDGVSGHADFNETFGKWVKGCWEQSKFGRVSKDNEIEGYVYEAKALDTETDASAGFLVPELMAPTLYAAKDLYGELLPLLAKLTVPAGQKIKINREAVKPVAAYRVGANPNQNTAIPTTDPTYGRDVCSPELVGSLITVSNELLGARGVNYTELVAPQMLRAIVLAEEDAVCKGVAGTDSPSDGFLEDTGVEAGAAVIGGDDLTDWLAFVADAVAAVPHLNRIGETVMMTTPAKQWALAAAAVGTNVGQALAWADPVQGLPQRLGGFPFYGHPGMFHAKDFAAMFNPQLIVHCSSGQLAVDVNPYGEGFRNNSSDIRVFTHSDFTLNDPAWIFRNSWA